MRVSWVGTILVGTVLFVSLAAVPAAEAQDFVLTALVLVNAQNAVGYSTNPQAPGEFQRFTERYLEHLQTPYQVVDVATQAPLADLSRRQLIISAHRGLNPGATWQTAITNAVAGGVGFVNLDSDATVGQQAHIQSIFGASGSSVGTPGTAIRVPQAVVLGGTAPHFIAEDISVTSIAEIKSAYETTELRAKLARWHNDVDNAFYGWNGAWLDPQFRAWDISEYLAYIRVPVAIVQGANDQYGTVRQVEIAEQECYCPVEVTMIPGAGHSPQRDAPEATLGAIAEFAKSIFGTHENPHARAE